MHATTQNVYQYEGTNREYSITSVSVQTKFKQRTLSYSENFIAPELHIGQKERKTARLFSDVLSTEHQSPNKCIIEDKSIVVDIVKVITSWRRQCMGRMALALNHLLGISSTK